MKVKQVLTGYGIASAATVAAGLVAADFLEQWTGEPVDRRLFIEAIWLAAVGVPSLWVAGEQTLRALGKKPKPPWAASGRSVAVNALESTVRSVWRRRGEEERRVTVSYMYFTQDANGLGHTFMEDDVSRVLRLAWHRRRNHPWSRKALMMRAELSRDEYDAMMNLLQSVPGVVVDRDARRSGKMRLPPLMTLEMLRARRGIPLEG